MQEHNPPLSAKKEVQSCTSFFMSNSKKFDYRVAIATIIRA